MRVEGSEEDEEVGARKCEREQIIVDLVFCILDETQCRNVSVKRRDLCVIDSYVVYYKSCLDLCS